MARLFVTGINLNKNELQNARIQNLNAAPSSPVSGQIYFNTVSNVLYFYDGSEWIPTSGSTEVIQDAIGTYLIGGTGLTSVYDDFSGETTINLDNTSVTHGSYGSQTKIPTFTVDQQGRLTAAGEVDVATTLAISNDAGASLSVNLLNQTLKIEGGEGIDVTNDGGVKITVSAEDASDTNKGVASFNATDFAVANGYVSLVHESVQDIVGAMVSANTETGITVTYQDADGTLDLEVHDQFPLHTTTDLAEGTNLYYTKERVQDEINQTIIAGTGLDATYNDGAGTFTIDIDSTVATLSGTQTLTNKTLGSGTYLDSDLNAGGKKITNLGAPLQGADAATKEYVDAVSEGLHIHASAVAATTGNIAFNGYGMANPPTFDGVTLLHGQRLLVKNQTNAAENGIYVYDEVLQLLLRASDFDQPAEVDGGDFIFVTGGTVNDNTGWVQTSTGIVTIGTDPIYFTQFSGAGTYLAGAGLELNGNTFSVDTVPTSGYETITTAGGATEVKWSSGQGLLTNANGLYVPLGTGLQYGVIGEVEFAPTYGVRKIASAIGDGSATSIQVVHNLGTTDVVVQLYLNSSPNYQVEADVEHTSNSTVTLKFATAPSVDQYRVVIIG